MKECSVQQLSLIEGAFVSALSSQQALHDFSSFTLLIQILLLPLTEQLCTTTVHPKEDNTITIDSKQVVMYLIFFFILVKAR
jgi:hypothetical protein